MFLPLGNQYIIRFFFRWCQSRMTVYGWNVNIPPIPLFIFLAPPVKNTSLFCSSPLKIRNASSDLIAFFIPHAVRTYTPCPCWICITVFSTYHWSYNLDDIDLEKEDINQIVYEVVNHKAARVEDQDKRAPKPKTRKSHKQKKQP